MGVLAGKVAVIAGGTSGIGAAIARLFVAEGAKVAIAGRRRDRGEKLAAGLGPAASFVRADITEESDVKAMIEHAVRSFGRLDCLINNAGGGSKRANSIPEVDLDDFDRTIAVHLRGALAGIKYAVPVMAQQGSGAIITVASVNGVRPGLGGLCYAVAKAGAIHLTRCAAVELGEKGIRVNTISPGPIVTGIFGKAMGLTADEADENLEASAAGIAAVVPRWQSLQRVGQADDIAQAALYLASDASRLVSGHNLVVDGGICAGWPIAVARDDVRLFRQAFETKRAEPRS